MNPFNVSLTDEEANVMLTLMQVGVKGLSGDSFDQGSASYLVLKKKIMDAKAAGPKVEAVKSEEAA